MKRILLSALLAALSFGVNAATLNPVQLLNPAGSTSGQAVISTGPSTAPAWGNVTAAALAAQAANTVVANVTASSASPTAFAMPSCSGANNAIKYTSGTGFTCGSGIALTTGNLSQFAATTSAQLAGVLSDETGSGAAVFGTSPTIGMATINTPTISGGTINNATVGVTTPLAGKFTTLQATSTITPSSTAGIVGTTTNDSAQAGSEGETITATASGVAQTSTVLTNVTSIPLTAGQWDVTCSWTGSASSGTAGINFGLTTTTGAQAPVGQRVLLGVSTSTGIEMPCPTFTLKLASSATLFLTSAPTFSGTMTVGGTIWAVRRR
jgi:hypothetical protein